MKISKRILKSDLVTLAMADIGALYIRLVLATGRLNRDVAPSAEKVMSGEAQAVLVFWHARMLLLPGFKPPTRTMDVLISRHRDGRLISEVIRRFNIGTVSGSSSKGAVSGVRGVMEKLKGGGNISITPDGPRGPARQAAAGTAHVAQSAGLPVMPVAIAAQHYIRLHSWDRFMIPLPFSKLALVVGDLLEPDSNLPLEAFRITIERALNEATDRADRTLGLPIEPPPDDEEA